MKEYIFRDPIHGHISVQDPTVLGLIDAPEFQRLRRIRQLGTSFISYPGAEHTRFAHSLGVYHLMGRVLRHLRERSLIQLSEDDVVMAQCAALLHDAGHGPFSHAFEKITGHNHEQWTRRIILSPDTRIGQVLAERDPQWPARIAGLLEGNWSGPRYLRELISSQLDVDRMDYLLRDAFMCGVPYGQFDLERLIHTLMVWTASDGDSQVVLSAKGQHAAEEFLLARYFMYWNVYFHKATRASEVVLERLLQRGVDLLQGGGAHLLGETPPAVAALLSGRPLDPAQYLAMDETDLLYAFKRWTQAPDPVVADLSARFINRRLLGGLHADDRLPQIFERQDKITAAIRAAGFPAPEYYYKVDETSNLPYSYYVFRQGGGSPPILVLTGEDGQAPQEISGLSDVLRGISSERVSKHVLYAPKEAIPGILAVLDN